MLTVLPTGAIPKLDLLLVVLTSEVKRLPVELWLLGSRYATTVSTGAKRLVGLEIDPRHVMPDVDRRNNRWGRVP